jgi:hypothetical protein
MICERCNRETACYELYGEKLCDYCLITKKIDLLDPDYSDHISLPVKRLPVEERVVQFESKLTHTGLTRTLIDMSVIGGHNAFAYIADDEITAERFYHDIKPILKTGPFDDPRFLFCRPVFAQEKAVRCKGSLYSLNDVKETDMTDTLDVFFDFLSSLNTSKFFHEKTGRQFKFSSFAASIIGCRYYDCMHAGMNKKLVSLLKTLIMRLRPSLQTKVYHDGKGWNTIGDWLMEVHEVPEVNLHVLPDNVVKALTE